MLGKIGFGIGIVALVVLVIGGSILFTAWLLMVLWGALVTALDGNLSTISYGAAVLISLLLHVIGSFFSRTGH